MKVYLTICILISSFLGAQTEVNDSFYLEGSFSTDCPGYIFLHYDNKIDSCLIKTNTFTFRGNIKNDVTSANISLKNDAGVGVYLEKGKHIKVDLSYKDVKRPDSVTVRIIKADSVSGTRTSVIQDEYESFATQIKTLPNYDILLLEKASSIINHNPTNPFSANLLYGLTFNKNYDRKILRELYTKLHNESLSDFHRKQLEDNLFPENRIKLNDDVFNFSLPDVDGNEFDTSSLKGKWFLIDFWASWCSPCIEQMPELLRIFKIYKDRNFQIIGVSLDKKKQDWIKAINEFDIDWINVNDNNGFYGEVVKRYQVNEIPKNYLVNPAGQIVRINISPSELEVILKDHHRNSR